MVWWRNIWSSTWAGQWTCRRSWISQWRTRGSTTRLSTSRKMCHSVWRSSHRQTNSQGRILRNITHSTSTITTSQMWTRASSWPDQLASPNHKHKLQSKLRSKRNTFNSSKHNSKASWTKLSQSRAMQPNIHFPCRLTTWRRLIWTQWVTWLETSSRTIK